MGSEMCIRDRHSQSAPAHKNSSLCIVNRTGGHAVFENNSEALSGCADQPVSLNSHGVSLLRFSLSGPSYLVSWREGSVMMALHLRLQAPTLAEDSRQNQDPNQEQAGLLLSPIAGHSSPQPHWQLSCFPSPWTLPPAGITLNHQLSLTVP